MDWKKDREYICILSKSPGYKEGEVYKTYLNNKRQLCMKGRDGFEDIVTNLMSGFKEFHHD